MAAISTSAPTPAAGAAPDAAPETPKQKARRWRGFLSFVLLALAIVCLILGSLFVWMRATAYNPNGYVASALQVQGKVQLQGALTNFVRDEVLPEDKVMDVAQQATDLLPIPEARKQLLATVLTTAIRSQIGTVVDAVLNSGAADSVANRVTTRASEEVVKLLRDNTGVFRFKGDAVVFDTTPIAQEVRTRLEDNLGGLARFLPPPPEAYPTYTLVQGDVVTTTQTAISTIRLLSWLLPLLFVVLLIAGIAVARQRRAAAYRTMIAIAVAAVVVIVAIRIARSVIMGLITEPATEDVVNAILQAASTNLVDQTLWLALIAAAIGGVLWLLGPDAPARRTRGWLADRGRDLVTGTPSPSNRVTEFVRQHRIALDVGAFALGLLILLFMDSAGGGTWLTALIAYLIFAGLVEYASCASWMQSVVRWVRGLRGSTPAT